MFDMKPQQAHSIISKMMINQELCGSWDQPTETIVLQKVEPSRLQMLALQFANKVTTYCLYSSHSSDAISNSWKLLSTSRSCVLS
jgi:translation initiation factor 3 subunit C